MHRLLKFYTQCQNLPTKKLSVQSYLFECVIRWPKHKWLDNEYICEDLFAQLQQDARNQFSIRVNSSHLSRILQMTPTTPQRARL
eukprot:m.1454271 g.1454271  ORF g.1454271 m.1454271 type:complete len:85 (+) comp25119_c0_seq8:307-561(+)